MKIIEAKVYSLKCDNFAFAYGDAGSWKSGRILHLLELKLDNGLSGWGDWGDILMPGQTKTPFDYTPEFAFLIGQDPSRANGILRELSSRPRFTKFMLAAVDVALWDIRGKLAGLSLAELLGGPLRRDIPVYASFQNYRKHDDLAAWMSSLIEEHYQAGFRAFKFKIGAAAMEADQNYLRAARDTLDRQESGNALPIAVDANQSYTRSEALRMGRFLEDLGHVGWFEEPLIRADIRGYRNLVEALEIPISGAEGCATPQEVDEYLRAGALDIAQPDILAMGGITPMCDAIAIARLHHVPVYVHCFYSCLERIAALHLMSVQPIWGSTFRGASEALLEWETACFPARDKLLEGKFQPNELGRIAVPTKPGLGVNIRRDCIEEYLWR